MIVIYENRVIEGEQVWANSISSILRALSYGDGLFETMFFNGKIIPFFHKHFKRLNTGIELLGLAYNSNSLEEQINKIIYKYDLKGKNRILKLQVIRNSEGAYKPLNEKSAIVILEVKNYEPGQSQLDVSISRNYLLKVNSLSGIKHSNKLEQVLIAQSIEQTETLVAISNEFIVEGLYSNLIVSDGTTLYSPGKQWGAIEGIGREVAKEIAEKTDIEFKDQAFKEAELLAFPYVALVNSIRGIRPIARIESQSFETSYWKPFIEEFNSRLSAE